MANQLKNFQKNTLQQGCSKDPCEVEQAPYLHLALWHQGRNIFLDILNFIPGQEKLISQPYTVIFKAKLLPRSK
jgi:hypothetical protein